MELAASSIVIDCMSMMSGWLLVCGDGRSDQARKQNVE